MCDYCELAVTRGQEDQGRTHRCATPVRVREEQIGDSGEKAFNKSQESSREDSGREISMCKCTQTFKKLPMDKQRKQVLEKKPSRLGLKENPASG